VEFRFHFGPNKFPADTAPSDGKEIQMEDEALRAFSNGINAPTRRGYCHAHPTDIGIPIANDNSHSYFHFVFYNYLHTTKR